MQKKVYKKNVLNELIVCKNYYFARRIHTFLNQLKLLI